jgi:hypothetical protein
LLRESGVDNVDDSVDGERGFGDVGRDDNFATRGTIGSSRGRSFVENSLLLLRREGRVEGNGFERTDVMRELIGFDHDFPTSVFDFFFSRQKH